MEKTTLLTSGGKVRDWIAIVSDLAESLYGGTVHSSGNQTVAGVKTFSETIDGTASRALSDSSGNGIEDTYSTKSGTVSSVAGSLDIENSKIVLSSSKADGTSSTSDIDISDLVELASSGSGSGSGSSGSSGSVSVFQGATSSANGTAGLVPAPTSAQSGYYLKGDGTWADIVFPDLSSYEYISAIGTGYIRYRSGMQICYQSVEVTRSDPTFTFPVPFNAVPSVTATLNESVSRATSVQMKTLTATNFSASVYSNTHSSGTVNYIAVGTWQ